MNAITLDTSKVQNVELDGIDHKDSPDFADAYISWATYNGVPMTDEQLEQINNDKDFVHTKVLEHLF